MASGIKKIVAQLSSINECMSAFTGLQFGSEYEVDESEEDGGEQEGERGSESEEEVK